MPNSEFQSFRSALEVFEKYTKDSWVQKDGFYRYANISSSDLVKKGRILVGFWSDV